MSDTDNALPTDNSERSIAHREGVLADLIVDLLDRGYPAHELVFELARNQANIIVNCAPPEDWQRTAALCYRILRDDMDTIKRELCSGNGSGLAH
jgi:hypothetical protein